VGQLLEFVVAMAVVTLVTVGLATASVALWVRARRRRARARVQRVLDTLAAEVADRLAAGRSPGRALTRYKRLTDEAAGTRTWCGMQRLLVRERVLDGVDGAGRALTDPAVRARAAGWAGDTTARLLAAVPAPRRPGTGPARRTGRGPAAAP
jgi:hypothetical protein